MVDAASKATLRDSEESLMASWYGDVSVRRGEGIVGSIFRDLSILVIANNSTQGRLHFQF